MTADPGTSATSYERATSHYLSPDRRDPVKRLWEEPFSRSVLGDALRALDPDPARTLRVLDVGAGVGDGLRLLEGALAAPIDPPLPYLPVSYVGLDVDGDMVAAARDEFRDRPGVGFVQADIRSELPDDPFDLYMSAGVPYSHLTPDELTDVVTGMFTAVRSHRQRSVVLLDVLGRYSHEWAPNWARPVWDYDMSFFSDPDGADAITARMTFHSRDSVRDTVTEAADRAGVTTAGIAFYDRSVAVGRHTSTGAFNPGLAPYRLLLNRLFDGDVGVRLDDLSLVVPDGEAPREIGDFFSAFARAWNTRLEDAADDEGFHGATPHGRAGLARALCGLEHGMQRGLGAGHSLMAVAVVDGRG